MSLVKILKFCAHEHVDVNTATSKNTKTIDCHRCISVPLLRYNIAIIFYCCLYSNDDIIFFFTLYILCVQLLGFKLQCINSEQKKLLL